MRLDSYEEEMATGKHGPGKKRCMEMLIKFGKAMGAERMVPISSAHTMPKEPLELLEELTEGVEKIDTTTTLHPTMSAFCLRNWSRMGISEEFAAKELPIHSKRQEIYKRLGFFQTYSCLPMLAGNFITRDDQVSWIGTGLQLLTNSFIGARTNRDGTVINLASAITGRTPYYGLMLEENRKAQVLVMPKGIEGQPLSPTDLGAIGYYVGDIAQNRNVVFGFKPGNTDFGNMRYLLPPLSVSGSVAVCHIVGATPEAPSLEAALGNSPPSQTIEVGLEEIDRMKALYKADPGDVQLAIFGCSHCTIQEIMHIARYLDGKKLNPEKRLWIGTAYQTYDLAKIMGFTDIIEKAGGVFASACMATIPECPIPESVEVVATNSFKAAHYISRLSKGRNRVWVADLEDCLDAVLRP